MTDLRTERGLDRLVNFSDATVAIAITLLILPLVDVATEIQHEDLGTVLHQNLGSLISFVVTFAVIGRFWMLHHTLFERVSSYSRHLVYANFLWLAGIVFLPFAANVLSGSEGQPSISALYIGTMIVITGASTLMERILLRDPSLVEEGKAETLDLAGSVIALVLLIIALLLALVSSKINLYGLFVLVLSGPIERVYGRVTGRRATKSKE